MGKAPNDGRGCHYESDVREPLLLDRVRDRVAAALATRLDRRSGRSWTPSVASVGGADVVAAATVSSMQGASGGGDSHSDAAHRTWNISSSVGLRGVSTTAGGSSTAA